MPLGLVVVVPLTIAGLVFLILFFMVVEYALYTILGDLGQKLPRPISGAFVGAVKGAVESGRDAADKWLAPQVKRVVEWWYELANASVAWERQVIALGIATAFALEQLQTRLLMPGTGIIPRLDDRLRALNASLYDERDGWVWRLGRSIDKTRADILNPETGALPQLERRFNVEHDNLFAPARGIIPQIRASHTVLVDRLYAPGTGSIVKLDTSLDHLADRLHNPRSGEIPQLQKGLAATTEKADGLADYLAPSIALFAAPAVAAAIDVALDNEQKLRRFCSMEVEDFEQAFGFALVIPSLAMLLFAAEQGAHVMQALADEVKESFGGTA